MLKAKARFIHFVAEYQTVAALSLRASEDRKYNKKTKYGYCRGTEPVKYVKQILIYYDILRRQAIEYKTSAPQQKEKILFASKLFPLTTSPGLESQVAFSPDDSSIVYIHKDETTQSWNIYLKKEQAISQITNTKYSEIHPRFSPDGKNIVFGRAYNSDHQVLLIKEASNLIREKSIKLIIVDSLIGHFRSEYVGRGTLANRQQTINSHLHDLLD